MGNAERVLQVLNQKWPDWLSNAQIGGLTGISPAQQVFQLTQKLIGQGQIAGEQRGNTWFFRAIRPTGSPPEGRDDAATPEAPDRDVPLSEDAVKCALKNYLRSNGWEDIKVAWGKSQGADIEAKKDREKWVIEAKGIGKHAQARENYFLAILGQILRRMEDPEAKYSIALPDLPQFRKSWKRLPHEAKARTRITALFVDAEDRVTEDSN